MRSTMASIPDDRVEQKYALEQIEDVNTLIYHELRTPLTSIYGVLKILENQEISNLSEEGLKLLNMAIGSANRLTRLTNLLEHQNFSLPATISSTDIEHLQLENDLYGGLRRQEFFLNYQPIVAAQTGKIVGFEALARWRHPAKGVVSPTVFIPLAEKSGFIKDLGLFLLEEACQQLSTWQQSFPTEAPLLMSINLSTIQLAEAGLSAAIEEILDRYVICPETLKLEVTESSLISNEESALKNIERLKALGIKVYLDDFGTGYSSLSRLQDLPFDALKIDRSFIIGQNWLMSEMIIALAERLDIDVIAEGIETPEQLAILREIGCQKMQGYFFSRPVGEKMATYLLSENTALGKLSLI
ncbi:MAG: EAL domain-containing protein [Cyanobacteria bacterium]|nr:EAL domain-containing protein [Cyanobacteriota bacterium]